MLNILTLCMLAETDICVIISSDSGQFQFTASSLILNTTYFAKLAQNNEKLPTDIKFEQFDSTAITMLCEYLADNTMLQKHTIKELQYAKELAEFLGFGEMIFDIACVLRFSVFKELLQQYFDEEHKNKKNAIFEARKPQTMEMWLIHLKDNYYCGEMKISSSLDNIYSDMIECIGCDNIFRAYCGIIDDSNSDNDNESAKFKANIENFLNECSGFLTWCKYVAGDDLASLLKLKRELLDHYCNIRSIATTMNNEQLNIFSQTLETFCTEIGVDINSE